MLRTFYLLHTNLVCFICSDWTKFHRELVTLKEIFQRNDYPKSFIDNCCKKFLYRLHIIRPALVTVGKKPLRLLLPYFASLR